MTIQTILEADFPKDRFSDLPVPTRAGVGLKAQHVRDIVDSKADIGFVEVHAENYMGAGGMPHQQLAEIRETYPVSVHGVGMSIGGERPIDPDHLARFKAVVDCYNPALISEHLAWSTHDDVFFNDLLPVPYTKAALQRVIRHVGQVQDSLGRQILIENPSTYVTFAESEISEVDFMEAIARQSGCGLLFDVNNVYVSATNHQTSPAEYIDAYPLELVKEIHLAGHADDEDDEGRVLLIDAHDREVNDDVWALYRRVLAKTGPLPSLVEWDNDVPQWPLLYAEAKRADTILADFDEVNVPVTVDVLVDGMSDVA